MSTLMERVAEQAERDPDRVLPVLEALVGQRPRSAPRLRQVAERVGAVRRQAAVSEFIAGSLTTEQAVGRLPGATTRQAVHRLRDRGRLLGRTIGNATWFPAWQFGDAGLRDDLPRVLTALRSFTSDALAADRIMRLPREELGGSSIAEALQDPEGREPAERLLDRLGGGF